MPIRCADFMARIAGTVIFGFIVSSVTEEETGS
jgi:hypothetical protein